MKLLTGILVIVRTQLLAGGIYAIAGLWQPQPNPHANYIRAGLGLFCLGLYATLGVLLQLSLNPSPKNRG